MNSTRTVHPFYWFTSAIFDARPTRPPPGQAMFHCVHCVSSPPLPAIVTLPFNKTNINSDTYNCPGRPVGVTLTDNNHPLDADDALLRPPPPSTAQFMRCRTGTPNNATQPTTKKQVQYKNCKRIKLIC